VLLDAQLGANVQNYSAGLSRWEGHPLTRPSVVVERLPGNRRAVQVSWNGATEVAQWRILAGPSAGALSPVASARRTGFQTTISTRATRYLSVQALDRAGAVIGVSRVVTG
jgi:hypothetical protein